MQKWIGIGQVDEEPKVVKLGEYDALLMWIRCKRAWDARFDDAIPVLWLGKRKANVLKLAKTREGGLTGVLVYACGELSSRVKIEGEKEMTFGCAVFGTSITLWDAEAIAEMEKKSHSEESLMGSSLEDL